MAYNFDYNVVDEKFTAFKTGYFPSDISAIGEYHYYKPGFYRHMVRI